MYNVLKLKYIRENVNTDSTVYEICERRSVICESVRITIQGLVFRKYFRPISVM